MFHSPSVTITCSLKITIQNFWLLPCHFDIWFKPQLCDFIASPGWRMITRISCSLPDVPMKDTAIFEGNSCNWFLCFPTKDRTQVCYLKEPSTGTAVPLCLALARSQLEYWSLLWGWLWTRWSPELDGPSNLNFSMGLWK